MTNCDCCEVLRLDEGVVGIIVPAAADALLPPTPPPSSVILDGRYLDVASSLSTTPTPTTPSAGLTRNHPEQAAQ